MLMRGIKNRPHATYIAPSRSAVMMKKVTLQFVVGLTAMIMSFAVAFDGVAGAAEDNKGDTNRTGQSQKPGVGGGPANQGNPAQESKPALPGDQPAKEGMDPSSQVHNIDRRDLEGKKHSD